MFNIEYQTVKLEDVLTVCSPGQNPNAFMNQPTFVDTGYPYVRIINISDERILDDKMLYLTEEEYNKVRSVYKPQVGDLIYGYINADVGNCMIVSKDGFVLNSNLIRMSPNHEKIYTEYLYLMLQSNTIRRSVKQMVTSSAMPILKFNDIKNFFIPVPSLKDQKKILSYIWPVHQKMKLVRKRIDFLKSISKSLFQNICGKSQTEVPFSQIGTLAKTVCQQYAVRQEDGMDYIKIVDINNGFVSNSVSDHISKQPLIKADDFLLQRFDGVVASVGSGDSVGKMAMITSNNLPCFANSNLLAFRKSDQVGFAFFYETLSMVVENARVLASGSGIKRLKKNDILESCVPMPRADYLNLYNQAADAIYEEIDCLIQEFYCLREVQNQMTETLFFINKNSNLK